MSDANDHLGLNSWQRRWASLADRLEAALENNAYRAVLCMATIVLVVGYIAVGARIVEPPRWRESRLIAIEEPSGVLDQIELRGVDAINRSIARMEKLASILNLTPHHLVIRISNEESKSPYLLESRILRLWLDEFRGFRFDGMYDVVSEALVHSILAVVFPDSRYMKGLPNADLNWFSQVKSLRETCRLEFRQDWRGLCAILDKEDSPNPLSVSKWISSQIVAEAFELPLTNRIEYLRSLVAASTSPELFKYEKRSEWPLRAREYGPIVQRLVLHLAPTRAAKLSFLASTRTYLLDLEVKLTAEELASQPFATDLLIVTSCSDPRMADLNVRLNKVSAHEVVWARQCRSSKNAGRKIVSAVSAAEFAAKNPGFEFVQVGVAELSVAIERRWLDSKMGLSEFLLRSRESASPRVAAQLRTQREDWDSQLQAFRMRAPVEVVKLVRLRPI